LFVLAEEVTRILRTLTHNVITLLMQ
jgi:hypothetical protein